MATADTARLIAALELQDKFSATASKYDQTIAGLEKRTGTLGRIGDEAKRGLGNAVSNLKTIGVVAAGAIASQVTLGVQSLAKLEEVKNQTDAVIESTKGVANVTSEEIRRLSEELENLSTVDDKVIQSGANVLLTFTQIRNEAGKNNDILNQGVEAALNMSVALGTDLDQAAIQVGKALNDPIRGIGALRRVGVQLTEEQEKSIRTFIEQGDVMKAQKVILAELETQFGGSAEAFGKGPGAAMRRFGDAVEGAQQALATGFLPLIERVSERVQEMLGDPKVLAGIEQFGTGLAGGLDDLIGVATKLPWASIGEAMKLMGTGAKAALDFFTSMPSWVQTAVLTGWGLNKLTGGALGGIVGELGKGLVKGVLGMNAGVVNINAATVNGPGGIGGAAGRAGGGLVGGLKTGVALASPILVGAAAIEVKNFQDMRNEATGFLEGKLDALDRSTIAGTDASIAKIQEQLDMERPFLEGILFHTNVRPVLEAELAELQETRAALIEGSTRNVTAIHDFKRAEIQALHDLNASEENRFLRQREQHAQAMTLAREGNSTLVGIRNNPPNVTVNTTVNAAISVSAGQVAQQVASYSRTVHAGPTLE